MSIAHAGSGPGSTTARKAMEPLSGAQTIWDGGLSSRVTWLSAPSASIQRTKIWPSRRKATRVPSGDQRGLPPSVRKRFFEPSAPMSQSSVFRRSFMASTKLRS